jgi:hypothetical protein
MALIWDRPLETPASASRHQEAATPTNAEVAERMARHASVSLSDADMQDVIDTMRTGR